MAKRSNHIENVSFMRHLSICEMPNCLKLLGSCYMLLKSRDIGNTYMDAVNGSVMNADLHRWGTPRGRYMMSTLASFPSVKNQGLIDQ
jgi:hypothetical protein